MNDRGLRILFGSLLGAALLGSIVLTVLYMTKDRHKIPHFKELHFKELFAKIQGDPGKWKLIILHHTATEGGNLESIAKMQMKEHPQWGGLAYHLLIGNGSDSGDGAIEACWRWDKQEYGVSTNERNPKIQNANSDGIAICLVGNFETDYPTRQQLATLSKLLDDCCLAFDIPRDKIYMHKEINDTACPGVNFPVEMFRPGK